MARQVQGALRHQYSVQESKDSVDRSQVPERLQRRNGSNIVLSRSRNTKHASISLMAPGSPSLPLGPVHVVFGETTIYDRCKLALIQLRECFETIGLPSYSLLSYSVHPKTQIGSLIIYRPMRIAGSSIKHVGHNFLTSYPCFFEPNHADSPSWLVIPDSSIFRANKKAQSCQG